MARHTWRTGDHLDLLELLDASFDRLRVDQVHLRDLSIDRRAGEVPALAVALDRACRAGHARLGKAGGGVVDRHREVRRIEGRVLAPRVAYWRALARHVVRGVVHRYG